MSKGIHVVSLRGGGHYDPRIIFQPLTLSHKMPKLKIAECREFIQTVSAKALEMKVPVAIAVVNA
jgi:hypothetical protein